jgi:arginyl-tRNA synthetase
VTPDQLSDLIVAALADLSAEGAIALPGGVPTTVTVERPRQKGHGDYATNVALQLAKQAGRQPRDFAGLVATRLQESDGISTVEVAGPGFLNIGVDAGAQGRVADDIVAAGAAYGGSDAGQKHTVNIEFVSANPTGPVTLASARWAAVGDTLARLLEATGSVVVREYYFNDHGAQIDRFSRSLLAAARHEPTPEDGYPGQYITEIAEQVVAAHPEAPGLPDDEALEVFRVHGVGLMFDEIKQTLRDFRVPFDVYFHENDLYESGATDRALARLRELGNIYEKDGATWLRTEKYGDDKDRVIVRSDGQGAYISGDAAYYLDKRERGFDRCIILLGADHHGYVGRMMALCAAFGDEPGVNLEIIIGQMVNLLSHGSVVRMGKRTGNIITLLDLVEAIGIDASRYALVRNSLETNLDIDLDLWTKATSDNPVFYVQYAHARICSVFRNAEVELGESIGSDSLASADLALLSEEPVLEVIRRLSEFPRVLEQAAAAHEPHRVAFYLFELASEFHALWNAGVKSPHLRFISKWDRPVTFARLAFLSAIRYALASGLKVLGVRPVDVM